MRVSLVLTALLLFAIGLSAAEHVDTSKSDA